MTKQANTMVVLPFVLIIVAIVWYLTNQDNNKTLISKL